MAKKKLIPSDGFGNARILPKIETYKPKPKPWIEGPASRKARLERERHLWRTGDEQQKRESEEYVELMQNEWRKQDKIK